jgi:hypothetical protein
LVPGELFVPGVGGKKVRVKILKNQKPVEYSDLLSYIIGMINTTFFPIRFDVVETGRTL